MTIYLGEIRLFAGNFAPAGWMFCQGQTLPIDTTYETLFNLIGTTYGGDGQSNFNLPNLSGRVPIHSGQGSGLSNYQLGETGGVETVTLTANQIPSHTHTVSTTASGQVDSPQAAYFATTTSSQAGVNGYSTAAAATALAATSVQSAGGNQPHTNFQPSLGLNFIIAYTGQYPSQN